MRSFIVRSGSAIAAAVAIAAAGCGRDFGTVPVTGRVTFGGGPPPAAGYLFFVPQGDDPQRADGTGPRSGSTRWAADGTFSVSTFRAADGLRPGTYRVRMECMGGAPQSDTDAEGRPTAAPSAVPAGFRPPDLVVPADARGPVRYDLDVR